MAGSSKPTKLIAHTVLPSDVVRSVLRLLFARGPSAILRAVMTIVVNAIQRLAIARPHVGEEVLKGLPTLADLDTTPAVAREVRGRRVGAPVAHSLPDPVFAQVAGAMLGHSFDLQASAALVLAASQVGKKSDAGSSARARANKGSLLPSFRAFCLNG